ncbi:hypothetical protein [Streptomyces sp. NPDC018055]|uniref:hypothetical protein n=1 Tax=Streptomyces sp. NPDC018055 TaxID=3365038 RepID=UPI0037B3DABD
MSTPCSRAARNGAASPAATTAGLVVSSAAGAAPSPAVAGAIAVNPVGHQLAEVLLVGPRVLHQRERVPPGPLGEWGREHVFPGRDALAGSDPL